MKKTFLCYNTKLNLNRIKTRKNNLKKKNISSNIYILKNIIKFMVLMKLFIIIKSNFFEFPLSYSSKITLKIRGTGDIAILGNQTSHLILHHPSACKNNYNYFFILKKTLYIILFFHDKISIYFN